ncbi:MAG: hypothetical protein ACK4V4_00100 [Sphingobacteriales bacterium]|jgi:hypothetical protein
MICEQTDQPTQSVLCLKWGDRYGSEYVNRLYSMVSRNTKRPFRLICFTDDPTGIREEVDVRMMPEFDLPERMRFHPFRRMFIFKPELDGIVGNLLHLDLDLLVTGSIDEFFDFKPELDFVVAENWTQPGQQIGNMSVFRFRAGALTKVWDRFRPDPMAMMDLYRNSQTFVCRTLGKVDFFPSEWCLSFKHSLIPKWPMNFFMAPKLPVDTKIVAFTGKPDIDEAASGKWPVSSIWKRLYKHVRPTRWIADHWR